MHEDQSNPYCDALDIEVPRFEDVVGRPEAKPFGLLVTALLEHGAPMTLEQVARRFEDAGVSSAPKALTSLRRSRPATRPIHRDGDLYELDPHDHEAKLWTWRLRLHRRQQRTAPRPVLVEPPPPGPEVALKLNELEWAFGNDASLGSWSGQRLALAVLDAHGEAMEPEEVVAYLSAQTQHHRLRADTSSFERKNSAVVVGEDGRWSIAPGHDALGSAREAVRARAAKARASASHRPSAEELAAARKAHELEREAELAWLAAAKRGLIHAVPPAEPAVVVLADLGSAATELFTSEAFGRLRERLAGFDIIAGIEVRALLRRVGFEPGVRRLAELGPPQKTRKFSEGGRPVKLNVAMMIRGSCGIERPLTPEATLSKHLVAGDLHRVRRALDSDIVALRALYEYGCLHGAFRGRWRQHEVMLPLGWSPILGAPMAAMCEEALETDRELEVVLEPITDWREPWAQSERVSVERGLSRWSMMLVDEVGREFEKEDVQLARLASDRQEAPTPSPRPRLMLVPNEPEPDASESEPVPTRAKASAEPTLLGRWRITSMETWGADYYDMDGPAYLSIESIEDDTALGHFQFGLVVGEMDCRLSRDAGEPTLRFCWTGRDEDSPSSGRGWLELDGDEMRGQIFVHLGDESTFVARRMQGTL